MGLIFAALSADDAESNVVGVLPLLLHVGGKEQLTSRLYCHGVKEVLLPSSPCGYICELQSSKISFVWRVGRTWPLI